MLRFLLIAVVFFTISGCVSRKQSENLENCIQVGMHIDNVEKKCVPLIDGLIFGKYDYPIEINSVLPVCKENFFACEPFNLQHFLHPKDMEGLTGKIKEPSLILKKEGVFDNYSYFMRIFYDDNSKKVIGWVNYDRNK